MGSNEAGRPTLTETEVTPAMLDLAVDVFLELPELLGPSPEELRAALAKAFRVMLAAAPKPPS